jgi:deaminated glutathione amidase
MSKVAIAQIKSSTDKEQNVRTAISMIEQAGRGGAELIAFPEFLMAFSPASQSAEELAKIAEPVNGHFISTLCEAARKDRIAVLATIYEVSTMPSRVFDTAVWLDALGNIAMTYRKIHLYDAFGFKESDKFAPGSSVPPPVISGECRFGVMICYDLRFPEMARMLALQRANILVAPSGWVQGDLKLDHWQTMIKARALENGCYIIAPGQTGNIYIGHSMIVDPLGRTIASLGEREGLEFADLDLKLISETRERLPLLANRRADVYARSAAAKFS